MENPDVITVSEAAKALGATNQTIRNWIRSGRLAGIQIGHRFFVPRQEVQRLHGDLTTNGGDGPWEHTQGVAAPPLPRRPPRPQDTDPADGLLGYER